MGHGLGSALAQAETMADASALDLILPLRKAVRWDRGPAVDAIVSQAPTFATQCERLVEVTFPRLRMAQAKFAIDNIVWIFADRETEFR